MFASILDRLLESAMFAKWYVEELDSIFLTIFVSHLEELFEIFFGTRIEARGIERDMEPMGELGRDHHPHIIAVGTLFSSLWRMLDSLDPSEKIANIICSLDIGNILDLTYLHECIISLIVLRLGLDVGVIPKTYDIVVIPQLYDRHCHIRPTTDMDEDFWFFVGLHEIEFPTQYIFRYLSRETWDDEFWIFLESRMDRRIFWDELPDLSR